MISSHDYCRLFRNKAITINCDCRVVSTALKPRHITLIIYYQYNWTWWNFVFLSLPKLHTWFFIYKNDILYKITVLFLARHNISSWYSGFKMLNLIWNADIKCFKSCVIFLQFCYKIAEWRLGDNSNRKINIDTYCVIRFHIFLVTIETKKRSRNT